MRRQAESVPAMPGTLAPEYRSGRGEATGLATDSMDAVVCCQAFHWLDPALALPEFHRILKPGGWAALMWNERDESDPFTAAYGKIIRSFPDAKDVEGSRQRAGQAFLDSRLFADSSVTYFSHAQEADEDRLIGRAMSVSYAPRTPADRERAESDLRRVFRTFAQDRRVLLVYRTSVFTGCRNIT
jgi:SAM-dependent methyltransferase